MPCLFLSDLGDSFKGFRCTRLGHDIQISNHTFIGHRGLLVVIPVVAHENWQNMNETDRDARLGRMGTQRNGHSLHLFASFCTLGLDISLQ